MVALGVLVVGVAGILAIFAAAAATHRRALEETSAAIIADSVVAEQRAAFVRNKFGEPPAIKEEPVPGYELYSCSVTPTVLAREPSTGRTVHLYVEVGVHFMSRGKKRTIKYRTVFFRE
jgi:hypothetical protein